MPRRGIGLFGFVVATLLCAAGTSEIAQAATIGLTGGSSRAAPGKPMLFDFDWVLHPSVGIDQGDFSFSADFGNESPFQSIGPAGGECVSAPSALPIPIAAHGAHVEDRLLHA